MRLLQTFGWPIELQHLVHQPSVRTISASPWPPPWRLSWRGSTTAGIGVMERALGNPLVPIGAKHEDF